MKVHENNDREKSDPKSYVLDAKRVLLIPNGKGVSFSSEQIVGGLRFVLQNSGNQIVSV